MAANAGGVETIKRGTGTGLTPGGKKVKSSPGEHNTSQGDGSTTPNRDNNEHMTPIGDTRSMYDPRNKGPMPFTPHGGRNTHF